MALYAYDMGLHKLVHEVVQGSADLAYDGIGRVMRPHLL